MTVTSDFTFTPMGRRRQQRFYF